MPLLKWIILLLLSLGLGILFLTYLVVDPLSMSLYLFLSCLVLFILVVVIAKGFKGIQLPIAVIIAVLLTLSGYALATRQVLAREDTRQVPEITRQPGDPGEGHSAVIYFTHGEPETYDPIGWINQFREFDEQGIPFVPFLVRPIFIYQLRNHYLQVGSSHHRQMHLQMLESLEASYRRAGDQTTRFYISFLDDDPRPDAAVIQALNEGASEIIVAEVFLTISNHTAEGKHLIEEIDVEKYGAEISFTGPMWDSELLRSMFVKRSNENIGDTDKAKVGVLLVGHGQPDEWDEEWPTETGQEINFREAIISLLEEDGYNPDYLSQAWMEFKEPQPAELVENFSANGVEKVLFYSAAISADSIHSQYDVPTLVGEADVPQELELVNLGAWNNDPIVISAIREKIDARMGR